MSIKFFNMDIYDDDDEENHTEIIGWKQFFGTVIVLGVMGIILNRPPTESLPPIPC